MGFLSHRRRDIEVKPEQKWDFISLNDFKATSCFTPLAYGYLWFSLILSVAVYAVDVFTAYQLLAFDKWSSTIEPTSLVNFNITKWIFSVCIILSFVNLAYEYFRAVAIMRRGSVAECFLDSLAARLESIRMGGGRGWRRFLVFAELTKSKKGAEYIALFTFFSFQSWIRTLLCSGPRQAVNALTIYSVYDGKLKVSSDSFEGSLSSFFDKIRILAQHEPQQVVILSGMLFTLVIWVFSFLSLLLAAMFFVFYLWSYIPREDGGLTGFCERKVNKRLKQIVSVKINKAMAEEERKRRKAELKAAKKNGGDRPMTMQPSLPVLADDDLPEMPSLSRTDTFASFSEKTDRPSTPGSFEMNAMGRKPTMPLRSETKAPLLDSAAEMGIGGLGSPAPTLPPLDLNGYPPVRTATSSSNRSFGPGPQLQRMASNGSSLRAGYTASPATYSSETMPSLPPPARSPASIGPYNNYRGGPGPNQPRDNRWPNPSDARSTFDDPSSNGRASPAPSSAPSYRTINPMSPRAAAGMGMGGPDGSYPIRSATNPVPARGPPLPAQFAPPPRSMTAPIQQQQQQQQQPPRFQHHHPTGSNGSLRSMASAPGQGQGQQPYDRPPYQQQYQPGLGSNSSLRNVTGPYEQRGDGSEYGFTAGRPNPMTANSPRGPPSRGGYGGNGSGSGWGQDLERGGGGGRY